MKQKKVKEMLSIVTSILLSLLVFGGLFFLLEWNLFLSMGLSVGVYAALTLILKPADRIGRVDVSALSNGEILHEKLEEAGVDFIRMKKSTAQIREERMHRKCMELVEIADNILKYLTKNPQKISSARRYIDYYQETAANVMEHYLELQESRLMTEETESAKAKSEEAIATLKDAFEMQFEKLMQNELMDMDADLNLLKQTLRAEGYQEKEKKAGK